MGIGFRHLVCALVAAVAQAASAATYHVDSAGDDRWDGSSGSPWQTIQFAAQTMVAGDTVIVRPGIYRETVAVSVSGDGSSPITFQGSLGTILESPDPMLSLSAFDLQVGVGNIVIDGFEMRGGFHETVFLRAGVHDVAVRNCDIHDNRVGIWVADAINVQVSSCHLHHQEVLGMRVSGASRFIYVNDTLSEWNDDGWGCFGDADGFSVEETAADVAFANCVSRSNGEDGFDLQGDRMFLSGSESRYNVCAGLKLNQNVRIENAIVADNGSSGITSSSYFGLPTLVEVLNSTVANNAGQQMYFKDSVGPSASPYQVTVRNVIAFGPGKALEALSTVILTEDHNLLFREETASGVLVRHTAPGVLRAYTGQEINAGVWTADSGQGHGTFAIAPEFTDAEFHVASGTAAIDGGSATSAPLIDHDGALRPQGIRIDMGAYESATGAANHRPWADPGANRTKVAGARVDFVGYGSTDPDGDALTYTWDFGDSSPTAGGFAVSHYYLTAGVYVATLTVSDGGLSHSRTAMITVLPAPTPTPTNTVVLTSTPVPTGTMQPTLTRTITMSPTTSPTPTATRTPIDVSECGPAPRTGCREAGSSKFALRRDSAGLKSTLSWKWLKGAATNTADFGHPDTGTTRYLLCMYDEVANTPILALGAAVPSGGMCGAAPCWKAIARGGFNYKDPTKAADGMFKMSLKPGLSGKASVIVTAAGPNLDMPVLPLLEDGRVTVQLANSEGECWHAVYTAPALRSTIEQFKDRTP